MKPLLALALVPLCLGCGAERKEEHGRSSAATPPVPAARAPGRAVYTHERDDLADVYDLEANALSIRSRHRLDRPTEFGGPLIYCSTAALYCLRSGLEVAVPKTDPLPPSWSTAGYECAIVSHDAAGAAVRVQCRFRGDSATIFDYSRKRGILRYRRVCPRCRDGYFELASPTGLFAEP
jgi:hypothetical protein